MCSFRFALFRKGQPSKHTDTDIWIRFHVQMRKHQRSHSIVCAWPTRKCCSGSGGAVVPCCQLQQERDGSWGSSFLPCPVTQFWTDRFTSPIAARGTIAGKPPAVIWVCKYKSKSIGSSLTRWLSRVMINVCLKCWLYRAHGGCVWVCLCILCIFFSSTLFSDLLWLG